VVLEALACGTPVIATPLGSVREILEGVAGCMLAESVTATGLAKSIGKWRETGKRPIDKNVVAPFLIQKIMCQYQSIFLE